MKPLSEQLTPDIRTFLWGALVAFSGKAAVMTGASGVTFWLVLVTFLMPLFMPLRYVVASLVACVVFLDASLWFQQGLQTVDTIYESAGASVKPPELLLTVLAVRLLSVRQLQVPLPRWMKIAAVAWVAVILSSAFMAHDRGTSVFDILVYSELRSPIVMVAGLALIAPLARANPRFFIDTLGTFVLLHFVISLLSWMGGLSLLWQSYALRYAGNQSAFFGADESVMVYLLVQAIALAIVLAGRPEVLTSLRRWVWVIILAVVTFAIVASLRRGGVGSSAIIAIFVLVFSGFRQKLRITAVLAVLVPALVLVANRIGIITALISRLSGQGSVAISDAGRQNDQIQAQEYIEEHFWLGTGPGTRLDLVRTQAETLSIHDSLLHVWVRFGLVGVVVYVALFAIPVLCVLVSLTRTSADPQTRSFRILAVSLAGFLVALYIWGLETPPVFLNFRQAGVWLIAVALLFAAQGRIVSQLEPVSTDDPGERASGFGNDKPARAAT